MNNSEHWEDEEQDQRRSRSSSELGGSVVDRKGRHGRRLEGEGWGRGRKKREQLEVSISAVCEELVPFFFPSYLFGTREGRPLRRSIKRPDAR